MHDNHYLLFKSFLNIYYLTIKLLTNIYVFYKHVGRDNSTFLIADIFTNSTILLVKRVALAKYISNSQDNNKIKKLDII